MRLISGILAGQNFDSVLIGDESLSKRPMKRVIEPLIADERENRIERKSAAAANLRQKSFAGNKLHDARR